MKRETTIHLGHTLLIIAALAFCIATILWIAMNTEGSSLSCTLGASVTSAALLIAITGVWLLSYNLGAAIAASIAFIVFAGAPQLGLYAMLHEDGGANIGAGLLVLIGYGSIAAASLLSLSISIAHAVVYRRRSTAQ